MKIRTGFVSNSSSSSFIMMVKEDHHQAVIGKMSDAEAKFIEETTSISTFLGMKMRVYGEYTNAGGYSTFEDAEHILKEEMVEELIEKWKENDSFPICEHYPEVSKERLKEARESNDYSCFEDQAYEQVSEDCYSGEVVGRWGKLIEDKFGEDAVFSESIGD